jgi:hypothetical protein
MSGGAIFRIVGLPRDIDIKPSDNLVPKLTGIFQAQQNEREPLQAISLGARLHVYLDLIEAYARKSRREERAENSLHMTVPIGGITSYFGR